MVVYENKTGDVDYVDFIKHISVSPSGDNGNDGNVRFCTETKGQRV